MSFISGVMRAPKQPASRLHSITALSKPWLLLIRAPHQAWKQPQGPSTSIWSNGKDLAKKNYPQSSLLWYLDASGCLACLSRDKPANYKGACCRWPSVSKTRSRSLYKELCRSDTALIEIPRTCAKLHATPLPPMSASRRTITCNPGEIRL